MSKLENNVVNGIKMLAIDMINEASSGHPGVALDLAPTLYTLYANHLNFRAKEPDWINRDRLVLSNGHASSLLYAVMHVAGYDIGMDDLKEFRRINSITPGHPEYKVTPGIEATTGPLGMGIAASVGMALAERYLSGLIKEIEPKNNLLEHYTYCICGDGDLMEGISYEALSFASTQKLNKLIFIYDANNMSMDGSCDLTFTDNLEDRFLSLDFDIIRVKNGTNIGAIDSAIEEAKGNKHPTLIIINTILGKDSLKENTSVVHGKPLSNDDINNLRNKYSIPTSFYFTDEMYNFMREKINKRMAKVNQKWNTLYNESTTNPRVKKIINQIENKNIVVDFDSDNYRINEHYEEDIRVGNNKIFNIFASKNNFILSGCADVSSSTKLLIGNIGLMTDISPTNRNIAFGVRENAMAGIANGMALSGLYSFISTYLTFSDYLKPSLRMSALMNLPVTYLFTHDSFLIGQDGPTHQPVEQLSSLRLIPNLITFRPADINEIIGIYEFLAKHKRPVAIVIGKDKLPRLSGTNPKYVSYGAYRVKREKNEMNAIFIATGSELKLALKLADDLYQYGIDARVVSMPSVEIFKRQNPRYELQLLPKEIKTFVFEFGATGLWNRFATGDEYIFGVDSFGKSGKVEELLNSYNLDYDSIKAKIIELMKK